MAVVEPFWPVVMPVDAKELLETLMQLVFSMELI